MAAITIPAALAKTIVPGSGTAVVKMPCDPSENVRPAPSAVPLSSLACTLLQIIENRRLGGVGVAVLAELIAIE